MEKAFTRNAAEAREVFDAAKEAGVFVLEAMWTRFLPHIAQVRHILESRVLGDIIVVSADHGQAFTVGPEHRLLNPDLAGGALLDLGVYPIAFAHDLLGHPEAITARGVLTDTGVDGQVSMIFDYPGRTQALLHTTQWGQTPTVASIVGTKGRIDIAEAFTARPRLFTPPMGCQLPPTNKTMCSGWNLRLLRSRDASAKGVPRATGCRGSPPLR